MGAGPARILEVELRSPLPDLEPAADLEGRPYKRALILVRFHSEPLGLAEVELSGGGLDASALAAQIWPQVRRALNEHLGADGAAPVSRLDPDGLGAVAARCEVARASFLERAPEMTVVIPSRERPERLERCLDSILRCAYPRDRFSVVVVDNAPVSDATWQLVDAYAEHFDGRVVYAREDAPGSASARNRGLALVETELVAMTDDDTIVDAHWLTEVARAFDEVGEAACVTGQVVPAELETPAQLWFEQYGGFTLGFERRIFDLDAHRPDDRLYPWTAGNFGTGNNFSFRTAALRDIGGFDPALGNGTPTLGGVDSEVLLRTVLSGHAIVYEPGALVHHFHRRDYGDLRRQVYSYGVGLTAYYLKTLLASPQLSADLVRRLPAALRYLLSPSSALNAKKTHDYPKELERLGRRGMIRGPLAYARSRRRYGPHRVPRMSTRPPSKRRRA